MVTWRGREAFNSFKIGPTTVCVPSQISVLLTFSFSFFFFFISKMENYFYSLTNLA